MIKLVFKTLCLLFVTFTLFSPPKSHALTSDQVKTFATSVATSTLGEVLPPPISLANDLVTNAPEFLKTNLYAHLTATLTNLQSSYDEDKLKGTPLKLFIHKKAKLNAMRSALMTQDKTALEQVIQEGERLRKEIKKAKEKRKKEKEKKRKKEKEEEHKTDLYMIGLYYEQYLAVVKRLEAGIEDKNHCVKHVDESKPKLSRWIYELKEWIPSEQEIHFNTRQKYCNSLQVNDEQIIYSAAEVSVGSKMVKEQIELAKAKVAKCSNTQDEQAIQTAYKSALGYFGKLNTAYEKIQKGIKISKDATSKIKKSQELLEELSKIKAQRQEHLKTMLQASIPCKSILKKDLKPEAKEVKKKIEWVINSYSEYPNETKKFKELLPRLNIIFDAYDYGYYLKDINYIIHKCNDFIHSEPISIKPCSKLADLNSKLEVAKKQHLSSLDLIKSHKYLATFTCKVKILDKKEINKEKKQKEEQEKEEKKTLQKKKETKKKASSTELYGGLRIAGPSVIKVGQAASLMATDAAGRPLQGSITWVNTREDLMSLSKSGNPSTAKAFKTGKATVLVNYIDPDIGKMQAWKDFTIQKAEKEQEESLFEVAGESEEEESLFAIDGDIKESEEKKESTQFQIAGDIKESESKPSKSINLLGQSASKATSSSKNLCQQNYQRAKNALTNNLQQAQYLVNISKGCDWTSWMQSQIERKKKCKQLQANFQAAINTQNAKLVSALKKESIQYKCPISRSLWDKGSEIIRAYNNRIKSQKEQQAQRQNSNINNVLSTIIKGVQGIQQAQKQRDRTNTDHTQRSPNKPTKNSTAKGDCHFCGFYEFNKTITSIKGKKLGKRVGQNTLMRVAVFRHTPSTISIRIDNVLTFDKPYPRGSTFSTSYARDFNTGNKTRLFRHFYNFSFTHSTLKGRYVMKRYDKGKFVTEITYKFNAKKF